MTKSEKSRKPGRVFLYPGTVLGRARRKGYDSSFLERSILSTRSQPFPHFNGVLTIHRTKEALLEEYTLILEKLPPRCVYMHSGKVGKVFISCGEITQLPINQQFFVYQNGAFLDQVENFIDGESPYEMSSTKSVLHKIIEYYFQVKNIYKYIKIFTYKNSLFTIQ
jgi:hypothetical protein